MTLDRLTNANRRANQPNRHTIKLNMTQSMLRRATNPNQRTSTRSQPSVNLQRQTRRAFVRTLSQFSYLNRRRTLLRITRQSIIILTTRILKRSIPRPRTLTLNMLVRTHPNNATTTLRLRRRTVSHHMQKILKRIHTDNNDHNAALFSSPASRHRTSLMRRHRQSNQMAHLRTDLLSQNYQDALNRRNRNLARGHTSSTTNRRTATIISRSQNLLSLHNSIRHLNSHNIKNILTSRSLRRQRLISQ